MPLLVVLMLQLRSYALNRVQETLNNSAQCCENNVHFRIQQMEILCALNFVTERKCYSLCVSQLRTSFAF